MAQTVVAWGNPAAQKVWSAQLLIEQLSKSYWPKFTGSSEEHIIQVKNDVSADTGDRVSFDLSVMLRGEAIIGDDRAEGKEEGMRYYTDEVIVDQVRKPVSCGGKMTRKRIVHNQRQRARNLLATYFRHWMDNLTFMTLSGARGINEDFDMFPLAFTGHAGNAFRAPDAAHMRYGGAATSKASLVAGDIMTRLVIERASTYASMMRAQNPEVANLMPTTVAGGDHYILLMSPYQKHSLRNDTGTANWLDIQKAAAAATGNSSPIFKGGLGMIDDVVLHEHKSVIRFNDYGAGANLPASRALFLGRQAGVIAYGTPKGDKFSWVEDSKDYGNEHTVVAGNIIGMQKSRFNGRDFGVVAIDTYAAAA